MSSDFNKKIIPSMDIGILANNLRQLMHNRNIDSAELSSATGIAMTTLNGLRRGVGNPTLSTLNQLAEFFNITIGQLTEENVLNSSNNSRAVYEIPLLLLNELHTFLNDKSKYKSTISAELDSWKQDKFYAIKINSNVMSPLFEKGTIFVIAHDTLIHDGDTVLVQFDHHPACFRKVFIEGKSYFFKPISDLIGDNTIKTDNFTIHGIVIKAIQHFYE